jgi:erythromycin esterase-like protein
MNDQRDVIMAENLNFLLENKYKNKKVILFGATYHFIKNNQTIQRIGKFPLPIESSKIMLNLLPEKLQKSIYTIGFTAYSGKYGMVKDTTKGKAISPAKEGSLEKKLSDYNAKYGIITFNTIEKKPDWFHDNLSIRLFRYKSNTASADWSKVLDAVFFIKEMKPIINISKE